MRIILPILSSLLFSFCLRSEAIYCNEGYILDSEIIAASQWNYTECPSGNQYCLRAVGLVTVFGFLTVNVTAGVCSPESTCRNQSCQNLTNTLLNADPDIATSLEGISYQLHGCDMICCNSNNCNNDTLEFLLENHEGIIYNEFGDNTTLATINTSTTVMSTTVSYTTAPSVKEVETTTAGSPHVGVNEHGFIIFLALLSYRFFLF